MKKNMIDKIIVAIGLFLTMLFIPQAIGLANDYAEYTIGNTTISVPSDWKEETVTEQPESVSFNTEDASLLYFNLPDISNVAPWKDRAISLIEQSGNFSLSDEEKVLSQDDTGYKFTTTFDYEKETRKGHAFLLPTDNNLSVLIFTIANDSGHNYNEEITHIVKSLGYEIDK